MLKPGQEVTWKELGEDGQKRKSIFHGDYDGGTGGEQQRSAMAPSCLQQDGVSVACIQLAWRPFLQEIKYPWPCKSVCSCILMARWTSGFDTCPRGDIPTHWTSWLQPPSMGLGFPGLSHADGCREREKNPSAALLGWAKGNVPMTGCCWLWWQGKAGGSHVRLVCVHVISLYILRSSAYTLWRATLLRRVHSDSKSRVWNPKN